MRKAKFKIEVEEGSVIAKSFIHFLVWCIIFLALIGLLSITEIFYFNIGYGISNGNWDILTLDFYSRFKQIEKGVYAEYKLKDDWMIHKIKLVNGTDVVFETFNGEIHIVDKENVGNAILFEIPIIRLYGKQGFLSACYHQSSRNNLNYNCEYMYCKHVEKRSADDCWRLG